MRKERVHWASLSLCHQEEQASNHSISNHRNSQTKQRQLNKKTLWIIRLKMLLPSNSNTCSRTHNNSQKLDKLKNSTLKKHDTKVGRRVIHNKERHSNLWSQDHSPKNLNLLQKSYQEKPISKKKECMSKYQNLNSTSTM